KLTFTNNTLGVGVTLFPQGNNWAYIMMASPLEDSIFTRLYFQEGHGLTKFRKFSEQQSVIGNRIVVWQVDWEGTEKNVHPYFQPEPEVEEVVEEIVLPEESMNDTEEKELNDSLNSSDMSITADQ
ncbi:hypothetical protein GOV09_04930, partial [Candidatus Woesearchaeota archaeon]|nr:hypothetical protein [Candidatus Woesearchaeota archaeon]